MERALRSELPASAAASPGQAGSPAPDGVTRPRGLSWSPASPPDVEQGCWVSPPGHHDDPGRNEQGGARETPPFHTGTPSQPRREIRLLILVLAHWGGAESAPRAFGPEPRLEPPNVSEFPGAVAFQRCETAERQRLLYPPNWV